MGIVHKMHQPDALVPNVIHCHVVDWVFAVPFAVLITRSERILPCISRRIFKDVQTNEGQYLETIFMSEITYWYETLSLISRAEQKL